MYPTSHVKRVTFREQGSGYRVIHDPLNLLHASQASIIFVRGVPGQALWKLQGDLKLGRLAKALG